MKSFGDSRLFQTGETIPLSFHRVGLERVFDRLDQMSLILSFGLRIEKRDATFQVIDREFPQSLV